MHPTSTGNRAIPTNGLYNPLVRKYTTPPIAPAGGMDGRMNTQGIGIHPNDGALRPQGILAYPRPLCTHRDREGVDPQGMVPSSNDGYLRTRGP